AIGWTRPEAGSRAGRIARDSGAGAVREPPEPYDPDAPDPAALTPDDLDDVADEITTLSAHIAAAEQRRARLVARYDASGAWKLGGHQSCANWLSMHTGLALHTAREVVRVARALEELPESRAAMARGALSFDQARALTRVAKPETESDLLELAEHSAPSTFERHIRAWKRDSREDEAKRERRRRDERYFRMFPNGDGMYRVDALVTPETAANTEILIDDNYRELYGKDRRADGDAILLETPREKARRRADAFGLGIERALAGLRGGMGIPRSDPNAPDYDPAADRTLSGLRAARNRVLVHVDLQTLKSGTEPGLSELADGTRLSAETARRIACDCSTVPVIRDGADGRILDVGRARRSIPTHIRRALQVRDRGCRFPGCANRFTDGHHVFHWVDGGPTSLANTMLLCGFHHTLVHEGGWKVQWWGREKTPVFLDPRGGRHASFRRRPVAAATGTDADAGGPVEALVERNRARGADPDALTAAAPWQRERDVPDPVLFRALEAVAPEPVPAAPD
ncbi:MAG: DUF222 domain-containing protein, partial [Gemmatimonadota bacterium]|nr:DUF222 domain-containing protein [Gemmatimonadota bacterium]